MNIAAKQFKIKKSYSKIVEDKLNSYLLEMIYLPMFKIWGMKPPKAKNSTDEILKKAIEKGEIFYSNGGFQAKDRFSNQISTELEKLGAVYDKYLKIFVLERSLIPADIQEALNSIQTLNRIKTQQLQAFIEDIERNLSHIIDTMVFDTEVEMILDDSGRELHRTVQHLNMISPELTKEQKQAIAQSYTENMDFYIEGWLQSRIIEMRKKVVESVLQGYRADTIEKMLVTEYGIKEKKAKFLAQNETSIMLAAFKKAHYTEMGFDSFIWKTILDSRERPLHKELNNKVFKYSNPPIIDDVTKQTGLPGETYNCRCTEVPIITDNVIDFANLMKESNEEKMNRYVGLFAKKAA